MQLSASDIIHENEALVVQQRHLFACVGIAMAVSLPTVLADGQTTLPPVAPTNGTLTLALVIQVAEAKYPAIRAAQEQQEAARNAIGVAKTAYLPRADVLWQMNRATTNRPNVSLVPQPIVPVPAPPARPVTGHSDWNTATGVLLAWQPFDFGVRRSQVGVAKYGYEAAQHATDLSRLDVESAAAGAYLDVVAAQQMVAVQQAIVNRMETFAKNVHVLVDNTLRPGVDASQADAQLALARTQLIQAQTQEQVRLEALANFLQVPAQQLVIDGKDVLSTPLRSQLSETQSEAHPQAQQLAALLNQQKEQIQLLSRSYVPSFNLYGSASGLGAGLSSTSSNPVFEGGTSGLAPNVFNWAVALQVTFPAFQIFTIHDQKKQQQAQVLSTQAAYVQTLGDLSTRERQAMDMLQGAQRVADITPVEVAAARDAERQQQARYKSGLATVVDVTTAEAALAQAEGDDAVARVNVWRGLAGVAETQGDLTLVLRLLNRQP
ncbi:MAG TPA: TolC family protein [Terracidiphilus sp.]|nr:TolC family protein [Terracidiphilus sp.]